MGQFLAWCEARGLGLTAVSPLHVAAYIRTHPGSAPTVKQHLAFGHIQLRRIDGYQHLLSFLANMRQKAA